MTKKSTMAEGRQRLEQHKAVTDWLIKNYYKLTKPELYEKINGDYIPFDLIAFLTDILDDNLRDALTLMLNHAIRDGQNLPGEGGGQAE